MMSNTVQSSPTLDVYSAPFLGPTSDLDTTVSSMDTMMDQDTNETTPTSSEAQHSPDPTFFDLRPPTAESNNLRIEDVMKRLISDEHLHFILGDHVWLSRFSSFLNQYRSNLVPTLVRYLEMRKALKAIEYANSLAKTIRWPSHTDSVKFSRVQASSVDARFEDYAARELLLLRTEALPLFITHTLVSVASDCITKDITGQSVPVIQDLVGDLAEVFCLTEYVSRAGSSASLGSFLSSTRGLVPWEEFVADDRSPSLPDMPIIYASEEFHRTTQYGTSYAINRNCRFLQGPGTDRNTTLRLAKTIAMGHESNEILLNYRRDGTPFVNLLMCAPLYDDKGVIRYYIGAQIDVTGLVQDGVGVESFRALLAKDSQELKALNNATTDPADLTPKQRRARDTLNRLQELSLMLSSDESEVVTRHARSLPVAQAVPANDASDRSSVKSGSVPTNKPRAAARRIINSDDELDKTSNGLYSGQGTGGREASLPGAYKHYLLVRPYPSLQIIFVSPSLRLPGLLRTNLFTKLGGSNATLSALEAAFRDGASVTAKVRWLPKNSGNDMADPRGKERFIRCCPLLGSDDQIGVWMVILASPDGKEPINGHGGYHSLNSLGMYGSHNNNYNKNDRDGDLDSYSVTTRSRRQEREPIKRMVIVDHDNGKSDLALDFGHENTEGQREGHIEKEGRSEQRSGRASQTAMYAEYLKGEARSTSKHRGFARTISNRMRGGILASRDKE